MVHDIVRDGDKHSHKTFGLGRSRFYAASHLKTEAKQFSMSTM